MAALEAKLLITAQDDTGKAIKAIKSRIAALSTSMHEIGRAASAVGSGSGAASAALGGGRAVQRMVSSFGEAGSTMLRVAGDAERAARGLNDLSKASREVSKASRSASRAAREDGHGDRSGRQMLGGIAGAYLAHGAAHFGRESLKTYREFDNTRRYGKAVMGITDDQQERLVQQAIHGSGVSKYNDIQWLEAQRELAARGLNVDQVLAITGVSAQLGQAMDKSLPDASKALEGGMFGFRKDTSSYEAAVSNARRTADLQVKASKISGMSYEDVVHLYKTGAPAFRMAGLNEEQLLAFGGVGKKSNMGGDEMGVAARALSANLLHPTAGAKTAMMANGIDYSTYQKPGVHMEAEGFSKRIAATYGVELDGATKRALQKVFDDKGVVAAADKFAPKILEILGDKLKGDDAKAKKSIAGEARRYRDASMGGVDAPKLFADLMASMAKNPSLANAIFGSKQGARIATAIGDPAVFLEKLDQLINHSEGFAGKVSDERMAGFDGAMSRLEGSTKALETALGRAFDNGGKGGMLTGVTDAAGRFVQALAEAPPSLQRLGVAAAGAAAAFAGFKGAEALLGGFGLKGSAAALTEAAMELRAAARVQGAGNAAGDLPGGGKKTGLQRVLKVAKGIAVVGSVLEASNELLDWGSQESQERRAAHNNYLKTQYGPWLPHVAPRHGPMARGDRLIQPAPLAGTGKIEATVSGPVTATLNGEARVKVDVTVTPTSALLNATAKSSATSIKANVGTSLPEAGTSGANGTGRQ